LEDPLTIHKYFDRIYALLPELDEESLITLATYFDPLGETMIKVLNFKIMRLSESERPTRMSGIISSQIEEVLHFLLKQQQQQQQQQGYKYLKSFYSRIKK
jgi:hypothetical protein